MMIARCLPGHDRPIFTTHDRPVFTTVTESLLRNGTWSTRDMLLTRVNIIREIIYPTKGFKLCPAIEIQPISIFLINYCDLPNTTGSNIDNLPPGPEPHPSRVSGQETPDCA
jgi:hypothetical protein